MKTSLLLFIGLILIGKTSGEAQTYNIIKSFGVYANVGANPRGQLVQGADGTLYGTTALGEGSANGTVFKIQPDGSGFTPVKIFTNSLEGANPFAGVTLGSNVLYGTTTVGGSSSLGTVFKVNTDGTGFAVLKSFTGSDGQYPYAGVTLFSNVLYGTTYQGGSFGYGQVFKMNTDGTGFTILKTFTNNLSSDGSYPYAQMILSGSQLYGTTFSGGSNNAGTVFKLNTDGTGYSVLKNFTFTNGTSLIGALTLSGSVLYGTAETGGISNSGTIFRLNTDGTGFAVLKVYTNTVNSDGAYPFGGLALAGSVLYGTTYQGGNSNLGTVFSINTDGTAYTVLKAYTNNLNSDGARPQSGLTLVGGALYGTTYEGGSAGRGTVFKVNPNGTGYAVLNNFIYSDAANPRSSLLLSAGVLYGTTDKGGSLNFGTVFKVNPNGTGYTVLKNFTSSDGTPYAGLTLAGGALYGATAYGGTGYGTLFKLNPDGTGYTLLKSYTNSSSGDGAYPNATLTLSGNVLYGTTAAGGFASVANGTVFKINTDGTGYAVLKNFTNSEGASPRGALAVSGSALYGTAYFSTGKGTVFSLNTDGTAYTVLRYFNGGANDGANPAAGLTLAGGVLYGSTVYGFAPAFPPGQQGNGGLFKMNTDGSGYAVLKSFSSSSLGANPYGTLLVSGGALYGTTLTGGSYGYGTVFKINTDGTSYTVLTNFTSGSGGANPYAGLVQSGNVFYGTTYSGGNVGDGVIYSLDTTPAVTTTPFFIVTTNSNFGFNGSSQFRFSLSGPASSNVVVSASTNLQTWVPVLTNPLSGGSLLFTDVLATNFPSRFYRANLQ